MATADSCLEAIEANTVTHVLTVSGVLSAESVPTSEMFKPMAGPDGEVFNVPTQPQAYPGAVISVNEDEVTPWEETNQSAGSGWFFYRVPVYVAIYATSDGTVAGSARKLAWKIGEAIQRSLVLFTPDGPLLKPEGSTLYPLEPAEFEPIIADATTYGLLMKFWCRYQIGVTS